MIALLAGLAAAEPLLVTREETLPNGVRVVAHQMAGSPWAAVRVVVPAGAADDPAGRGGLAHLVEHLAYEGTQEAPGNTGDRWIEAAGGRTDAVTTLDTLTFAARVPSPALPLALFLESGRLWGPAPDAAGLENQRAVVAHERAGAAHTDTIRRAQVEAVWPAGHPYRRTVLGEPAELAAASLDDVRRFAMCHLGGDGAVLAVVGAEPAETLLAEARRWFADVRRREPSACSPGPLWTPPRADGPTRVWLPADLLLDEVRVTWRTAVAHEAERVALEALAGVAAARLADADVRASHWSGRYGGELTFAASSARSAALVRRIEATVSALRRDGPTGEELARWRASTRTSELARLDTPDGRAEALTACIARTGEPDCLPAVWGIRAALSGPDVRDAARRWLGDDGQAALVAAQRRPSRVWVEAAP